MNVFTLIEFDCYENNIGTIVLYITPPRYAPKTAITPPRAPGAGIGSFIKDSSKPKAVPTSRAVVFSSIEFVLYNH